MSEESVIEKFKQFAFYYASDEEYLVLCCTECDLERPITSEDLEPGIVEPKSMANIMPKMLAHVCGKRTDFWKEYDDEDY